MNCVIIIGLLIILFIFIFILPNAINKKTEHYTLFRAHPNKFICSYFGDKALKHVVINDSGGVNWVSNNKPKNCKEVACHPLMEDDYTPQDVDHPCIYPKYNNLVCWRCDL